MGADEQRDGLGGPHAWRRATLSSLLVGLVCDEKSRRLQHTRRFSGTVLDGGGVRNTNPRPPLDEVGSMRIARGHTVSKLEL